MTVKNKTCTIASTVYNTLQGFYTYQEKSQENAKTKYILQIKSNFKISHTKSILKIK